MKSFVFLFFLASCSMIPKYERPDASLAKQWSVPKTGKSINTEWWKQFGDKSLDFYIQKALKNNQDLKQAIARVDAFYSRLGIVQSQLYPQIEAPVALGRDKISSTIQQFPTNQPTYFTVYTFGLKGSLDLDVWGKIRSATKEALAILCSEVEVRRTVVLNLVTSVASTYITLLTLDKQLKIAQETIHARDESYRIAQIRFDLGLTSFMQVDQARSELEIAMVRADDIAIQIAFGENQINFLLGRSGGTIKRGKMIDDFCMPPKIPSDLPSNLLDQRPDILAAEQLLIAANANIGVAKAEFFPSFNLSGYAGYASSQLRDLVKSASTSWDYALNVLQQVYTGGKLTSNLDLAHALKKDRIHNYLSTIFKACNEVNDALTDHQITLLILATLKDRVKTVRGYFNLANLRYKNGETDYLTFLDAERQLFDAELEYAEAQGKSYTTLVSIYGALGGGWVLKADSEANVKDVKNNSCSKK